MEKHYGPKSWPSLRALAVILSAVVLFAVVFSYAITSKNRGKLPATASVVQSAAASGATPPQPASHILTKDTEFIELIHPSLERTRGNKKKRVRTARKDVDWEFVPDGDAASSRERSCRLVRGGSPNHFQHFESCDHLCRCITTHSFRECDAAYQRLHPRWCLLQIRQDHRAANRSDPS